MKFLLVRWSRYLDSLARPEAASPLGGPALGAPRRKDSDWWGLGYPEPSRVTGGRKCWEATCRFNTCCHSYSLAVWIVHTTTNSLQWKLSWREIQTYVHTESCVWTFRAALRITPQNWTLPKCPSPGEWKSKNVLHPHHGIQLSNKKQQTIDTC